jgi:hypothetical protein
MLSLTWIRNTPCQTGCYKAYHENMSWTCIAFSTKDTGNNLAHSLLYLLLHFFYDISGLQIILLPRIKK